MSTEDVTVIAFRGTDAGEISDWLVNLGASVDSTQHGPIHRKFQNAYFSLQPQIMNVLRKKTPKHLWITGHSLGGALALVCAHELMNAEQLQIDGLITFGQPMVALQELAEHLNEALVSKYAHFVNNADIVPRVPPSFVDCGSLVWFTDSGVRRSKPHQPVFGVLSDESGVYGDTETDELRPMSEAEFEKLQAEMKVISIVTTEVLDEPQVYAAAAPTIEDHSMELYFQKVRDHRGVTASDPNK